jgi:hypothetical protein
MGIWAQAVAMAEKTPEKRNRYVDFLRAVSILVVITGHWLIAPFYVDAGAPAIADVLVIQPRTQWLTWLFQVMPIFFIVGGYANAVSLESARQKQLGYADWLATRLNRLVSPLLVLLFGWAGLAALIYFSPVTGETLQMGSRAALIPIWFLAIYLVIVVLAPLTYRFWRRWGFISVLTFAALAALDDFAFFAFDLRALGWTNYLWVWLGVHQLGYAWRDGRLGNPPRLLLISALAFLALLLLVSKGPYPLAMVGSPDEGLSNTLPPKFVLIVLGVMQLGILLAAEAPMRRLLAGVRLWAATALINSMIMTLYLWHLTVMVIIVALSLLAGGFGLHFVPATPEWWFTRPLWIGALYAVLIPVTLLLAPLERRSRPVGVKPPAAWRQVSGAIMICLGVALLARFGFGNAPLPYLDSAAFATVIAGAVMSGLLPGLK